MLVHMHLKMNSTSLKFHQKPRSTGIDNELEFKEVVVRD